MNVDPKTVGFVLARQCLRYGWTLTAFRNDLQQYGMDVSVPVAGELLAAVEDWLRPNNQARLLRTKRMETALQRVASSREGES